MMRKLMLLGAGAVGYVLGAKAGRERYEQIMDQAQKLRKNPTVQRSVEDAKSAAQDAASKAGEKVKEKTGSSHGTTGSATTTGGTAAEGLGSPTAPEGFGMGDEETTTPPPPQS